MSGSDPSFPSAIAPGVLPDGLRIYAVGDIHGRFDLLQALADTIRRDIATSRAVRTVEIHLGDYVDRGPDTRAVVEWMIEAPPLGDERICLMGNHEDLLLRALADPAEMSNWLFNGGGETVLSYLREAKTRPRFSGAALRDALIKALPDRHRAFFSSLPRMVEFGGYVFVHAGVRPGRPLHQQDPDDLIWIRQPFLGSSADFGAVVVHGHTPVRTPEVRPNRIDIDTGAVFSGCLTGLVLEGATRRFLQTG